MAIVLVTGANRGLGFEFVRQYAQDGWQVLACCRQPTYAQALTEIVAQSDGGVTTHQVDVADFVRIEGLASELKDVAIDVLINCAGTAGKYTIDEGAMEHQAFGQFDAEEWMDVYRINVMAPMRMSEVFIEQVAASDQKKIITLTSELGSMEFNTIGRFYPYRASKAAVERPQQSECDHANSLQQRRSAHTESLRLVSLRAGPFCGGSPTQLGRKSGGDRQPVDHTCDAAPYCRRDRTTRDDLGRQPSRQGKWQHLL